MHQLYTLSTHTQVHHTLHTSDWHYWYPGWRLRFRFFHFSVCRLVVLNLSFDQGVYCLCFLLQNSVEGMCQNTLRFWEWVKYLSAWNIKDRQLFIFSTHVPKNPIFSEEHQVCLHETSPSMNSKYHTHWSLACILTSEQFGLISSLFLLS